jgi:predicted aspartyl protease
VLVDTGAELSWIPAPVLESIGVPRYRKAKFRQASGAIVERSIGVALVHVAGNQTGDDIVFGEPTDLVILGSRTLEGLNFVIDPVRKQLMDAGPILAAVA